jgi:hypothetical protein
MKKLSEAYKEQGIDFTFPISIKNPEGRETYYEDGNGFWRKSEYGANGNWTYHKDSVGDWCRIEYDSEGNETYYENSYGDKKGTPRSQSCDGKVIKIDGKRYQLEEL